MAVADVMSSTPITPPGGINSGVNPLAAESRGAMSQADNCVFVAKDTLEPHRGADRSSYLTSSMPTTAAEFYNDTLFVQHGTKVSRDTGSAFTEIGTHSPPSGASMKFVGGQGKEANGCLYFTTSAGVYGIDSASGTSRLSGIARPGDFFYNDADSQTMTRLIGAPDVGWLAKDKAVAYRAVLGRKDANGNIKLSAPSGRIVIPNPADVTIAIGGLVRSGNVVTATLTAGTSHSFRPLDRINLTLSGGDVGNFDATDNIITAVTATTLVWSETAANYTSVAVVVIGSGSKWTQLSIDLPGEALATDFVQLYRTIAASGASTDPGDEMYLAYERVLGSATAPFNIIDTTPDAFLGEPLYTNANSGDGLEQANDRPPLAKDVALFDGRVWYANTTGRHRLELRLLGTGAGVSGLQSGDVIAINARAFVAGTNFSVSTEYSASLNIQRTISSFVYNTTEAIVGAKTYATHDGDNGTGGVLIEEEGLASTFTDGASGAINAIYAGVSRASAFADPLPTTKTVTSASTTRTSNVVTMTTGSDHGFAIGDVVMVAYRNDTLPSATFPTGLKTVATTPSATTFTYAETGANGTLSGTYFVYATSAKSIADTLPLMYSKPGLPDAVPLLNFIQDIPRGQTVMRIAPLRQMLFVFLARGDIWTVSGAFPYRVAKFDSTASLIAEGSLVEHANRLYCLTTQGVVAISEAGVEAVSTQIEPDLNVVVAAETAAGTLGNIRACSYESERQYRLQLSSTNGYYVLIYNSLHRRWTRRTDTTSVWGVVRRSTDKLYEGMASNNVFQVERKARSRLDYAILSGTTSSGSAGSGQTATNVGLTSGVQVGDIITAGAASVAANQPAWTVTAADGAGSVTATVNTSLYTASTTVDFGAYVAAFGPFTLYAYRAATSRLLWRHDALGSPQSEKQLRDLVLHFSKYSVASATANFTGINGSSSATATITAAAPQAHSMAAEPTLPISKRINVDDSLQTTPQLAVGLTVSEPFATWTLLGYSLEAEPGSERMVT